MNKVFIDSSFFKAYIDPRDEFHKQAISIFNRLSADNIEFVTSNYIIDETFTVVRIKCGIEKAKKLYETIKSTDFGLQIVRVFAKDEKNAWKWFWNKWSNLSFTDCVSFALMERLELKEVLTFDSHFSQAGMKVVE